MKLPGLSLTLAALAAAIVSWPAFPAVTVTVNGSNHTIPQTNEKGWGANVTAWIQAISQYTLQPSGGTFTLTAEVDTGATYGFKVPYIKTATSTPATAGVLRLATADDIGWRNNANDGNLLLSVDGSNRLTFNGGIVPTATTGSFQDSTFEIYDNSDNTKKVALQVSGVTTGTTRTLTVPDASTTIVGTDTTQNLSNKTFTDSNNYIAKSTSFTLGDSSDTSKQAQFGLSGISTGTLRTMTLPNANTTLVGTDATQTLTNKTFDADGTGNSITNIENADIKAAAAIALNKLAATTASRALVSDGSGFVSASATTATELGYVSGVTSAIQTQLGTKLATSVASEVYTATSSEKTPAGSGQFHDLTGNSITLAAGDWELICDAFFTSSGGSPAYSNITIGIGTGDGGDSGSLPTALNVTGVTVMSANVGANNPRYTYTVSGDLFRLAGPSVRVRTTQSITFYCNTFSIQTTSANARVTAYFTARRII